MAILLCDDEFMNRKVASKILNKEGYEVFEAEGAQEAYAILEKESIELILMDLMMPRIDGFEAIAYIKAQEAFKHIPILIISALSDQASINKGLEIGALDYLSKPFDVADFVHRIKQAMAHE